MVNAPRLAEHRCTARQGGQDGGDHRLKHRGHTGHHVDIADGETGCNRYRVVDQCRAVRDTRHALTRVVELASRLGVMRGQQVIGVLADADGGFERGGDGLGRDVVMGRANPARGEHVVIGRAQGIDRPDDRIRVIGHHPRLGQGDPVFGQFPRQIVHVRIPCPTGQDFITNNQDGGGGVRHRRIPYDVQGKDIGTVAGGKGRRAVFRVDKRENGDTTGLWTLRRP